MRLKKKDLRIILREDQLKRSNITGSRSVKTTMIQNLNYIPGKLSGNKGNLNLPFEGPTNDLE